MDDSDGVQVTVAHGAEGVRATAATSGWVGTEEVQRSPGRLERRFLKRV